MCHYDSSFRSLHKLYLSIMKEFGFGRRIMQTRILIEVEEMIKKLREQQGRPCDLRRLTMSCVSNVILSMTFGHRFDHSDPAFQQLMSATTDFASSLSPALITFPILRFVPHFRKMMAKNMSTLESLLRLVNNNIVMCRQVCICSSTVVTDRISV